LGDRQVQGGPKNGLFLEVDNFAMVKAWEKLIKAAEFCPEKARNYNVSGFEYSLSSLHKYSLHLK